jgi:hypothetical protein
MDSWSQFMDSRSPPTYHFWPFKIISSLADCCSLLAVREVRPGRATPAASLPDTASSRPRRTPRSTRRGARDARTPVRAARASAARRRSRRSPRPDAATPRRRSGSRAVNLRVRTPTDRMSADSLPSASSMASIVQTCTACRRPRISLPIPRARAAPSAGLDCAAPPRATEIFSSCAGNSGWRHSAV